MKCPRCGQFMIDKKEYCIHCGAEIYNENGISFTPRMLLIVMGVMVSFGLILIPSIMFFNTDKEVDTFMKSIQDNITVEQLYGDFTINKIIPGLQDNALIDSLELGWNVSIYENQFKISSCLVGCLDLRDITIEETTEHDFKTLSWLPSDYVEFKVMDNKTNETYYVVKTKTSQYLYIQDTFLQLTKDKSFVTNDNYHRIQIPTNTQNEQVNGMIKVFVEDYKAAVESNSKSIIDYGYFETKSQNITFLVLTSSVNELKQVRAIGYNKNFECISLKTYLEWNLLDVEIKTAQILKLFSNQGLEMIDLSTYFDYYVDHSVLYIIINGIVYPVE